MTLARAKQMVSEVRRICFLTGAGVSTESGLPDFRSSTGLYRDKRLEQILSLGYFHDNTDAFYEFYHSNIWPWQNAAPNAAHTAIAKMEKAWCINACITQNIDRLHQKAGSTRVVELHGNIDDICCLRCGAITHARDVFRQYVPGYAPRCARCGGKMKPQVVLFEEPVPPGVVEESVNALISSELLIVVGTSLSVMPAAILPRLASESGVRVMIINLSPTPFDHLADVVLHRPAGETLMQLLDASRS